MEGCIAQRRSANKNYRCMRKICRVDDERTKRAKDINIILEKERISKSGSWKGFTYIMKW